MSAGLRVEDSRMLVENMTTGTRPVERRFTDFFPTLMMSRQFSENFLMSANYRKTIQRPGFIVLTPFRIYIDDLTIQEGNPELVPNYIHSATLNGVLGGNLFVELEYRDEKNVFTNLPEVIDGVSVWKDRNFDLKSYGMMVNYGYEITNWWSGSVFGMGSVFDGKMNQENFADLNIPRSVYHTFGLENSFSLPKDLRLETTFNYTGPFSYGLANLASNHFTRIALKGDLLQKKLQYTLAVMDIFRGDVTAGSINSFNIETRLIQYFDNRRVQLGLVYSFGKKTVKNAQNIKLGNEDVIDRAN